MEPELHAALGKRESMRDYQKPAEMRTSCRESAKMFGLGQIIALFIGCTGLFAQLLATNGVDVPTVQNALNYFCLSFALIVHCAQHGWRLRLTSPWWAYMVIAFLDVEGNYAVTKAYQCTDITSIMLLDCMTIPTCFLLSRVFLRAQFVCVHYVAILLCLIGIVLIVVSDTVFAQPAYFGDLTLASPNEASALLTTATANASTGAAVEPLPTFCLDSRLVGDALCLAGSVLYGINNVAQEKIVKTKPIAEFLGMLGVFGFGFSLAQIAILEREELAALDWMTAENIGYICGFGFSLTSMYILTSVFLRLGDATFLNVSLLFSDFWAVVVSWFLFSVWPQWLYFVAAPFVITGCVVYSLKRVTFRDYDPVASGLHGGGTADRRALVEGVVDDRRALVEGVVDDFSTSEEERRKGPTVQRGRAFHHIQEVSGRDA